MGESSLFNKINKINNIKMQKITTSNIKQGVNIFGVNGTFTEGATATSAVIANGFNAYVNGTLINGSATIYSSNSNSIPNVTIRDNKTDAKIDAIYYTGYNSADRTAHFNIFATNGAYISIPYNNLSRLLNIDPVNIKKGSSILDVEGQYDASTEFQGIKMDPVVASTNSQSLITSIREISGLDTSNGINFHGYFSNLYGVISISNLEMSNITNAQNLCYFDNRLTNFDYINMYSDDASQSVNCFGMFYNCTNLISVKNTRFPKYISYTTNMFYNCTNLKELDNNMLIISYVNNAQMYSASMFYNCTNLTTINNIQFDPSVNNRLNAYSMFYNCCNLNIATINFNNCRLVSTNRIFQGVPINLSCLYNVLNTASYFTLSDYAFYGTSIEDILRPENTTTSLSLGTNASSLYGNCNKLTSVNLNYPAHVNHVNFWFSNCQNLTDLTVSLYNMYSAAGLVMNCQNLTDLTFLNYRSNTAVNIDNLCNNCLNLANVYFGLPFSYISSACNTFYNCRNLINIDINLTNANFINNGFSMFANCHNLKYVNISNINSETTDTVLDMTQVYYYGMFTNCYNLRSLNGSNSVNLVITPKTNTTKVSVAYMFANCYNMTGDFNLQLKCNTSSYPIGIDGIIDNTGFKNVNIQYETTGALSYYSTIGVSNTLISNCSHIENLIFNMYLNSTSVITNNRFYLGFMSNCFINNKADITFKITNWLGSHFYIRDTTFNNDCDINIISNYHPTTYINLWQSGISLTQIKSNNINIDMSQHSMTICNIYNCNINNLNIYESYNNCYCYGLINVARGSIGNLQIDFPSHANLLESINISNVLALKDFTVNIPLNAEIYNANYIYCFNCVDLTNIDINLPKIQNMTTGISISSCTNINKIDINIPNCTKANSIAISECPNIGYFNLNTVNLQTINILNISNCNLPEDLTINLTGAVNVNWLYFYNLRGDNFNNLTINLGNTSQLNRLYVMGANVNNPSNLSYINIEHANYSNMKVNYISFSYQSKLTDDCYDNLLGVLANINFTGSASYKKLSTVFNSCGKTQEYFSALSNYSNLIANGWTY